MWASGWNGHASMLRDLRDAMRSSQLDSPCAGNMSTLCNPTSLSLHPSPFAVRPSHSPPPSGSGCAADLQTRPAEWKKGKERQNRIVQRNPRKSSRPRMTYHPVSPAANLARFHHAQRATLPFPFSLFLFLFLLPHSVASPAVQSCCLTLRPSAHSARVAVGRPS